jgi:hypothetical protein
LRFGEELAKRRREAKMNKPREGEDNASENPKSGVLNDGQDVSYPKLSSSGEKKGLAPTLSQNQAEGRPNITPEQQQAALGNSAVPTLNKRIDLEMTRRQAEWQLEREAVSWQIRMANSSQVIVIDSEEDTPQASFRKHEGTIEGYGDEPTDHGDYADIWQQEARHAEPRSDSSSFIEVTQDDIVKPRRSEIPSPWKRGEDVDNSQDEDMLPNTYWAARRNGLPFFSAGKTQMARFRDQDVHLSSLLGTPESATRRFYQDGITPNSTWNQHRQPLCDSPTKKPLSSAAAAASRPQVDKTGQSGDLDLRDRFANNSFIHSSKTDGQHRVPNERDASKRLESVTGQTFSQREQQSSGKETMGGNDMRYPREMQWSTSEIVSKHQTSAIPLDRTNIEHHTSSGSWLSKSADSAPTWLSTPHSGSPTVDVELPGENTGNPLELDQVCSAQVPVSLPSQHSILQVESKSRTPLEKPGRQPLAVSGYFTDDHYVALRRLYRKAKNHPELFPYSPTPYRTAMLGQWMRSPDGVHCRRITEIQIAIVDRFIQDLVKGGRQKGSTGHVGWSEEELVRRLFSIIVGEQVRKERKIYGKKTRLRNEDAKGVSR